MAPDSDVFGRALLDWAMGATSPEVLEREDGFTQVGAGPMPISQISKVGLPRNESPFVTCTDACWTLVAELAGWLWSCKIAASRSLVSTRRPSRRSGPDSRRE